MTFTQIEASHDARYLAFGLRLASEIELPELPRADGPGDADVTIRFGEVPPALEGGVSVGDGFTATPNALLIDNWPARYLVSGGREIIVARKLGGADRDIRGFLLGSAMGAILHQRGLLPLHANAIEVAGRAVAFIGPSGAGKSTLAAHFRLRGRRVLCDDVCAVSLSSVGEPLAWPGIPRIKLWSDALAAFGRGADDLERVIDGEDKFSLPFPTEPLLDSLPLARIYVLDWAPAGSPRAIRSLSGAEAFSLVSANIYRPEFAAPLGQSAAQFASVISLLDSTKVFAAERSWGFDVFEAEADALERHFENRTPETTARVAHTHASLR